jgi:hypothetical protein
VLLIAFEPSQLTSKRDSWRARWPYGWRVNAINIAPWRILFFNPGAGEATLLGVPSEAGAGAAAQRLAQNR